MKKINFAIVVFCMLLLNFPIYVQAGDPGGPYVIVVNLSKNASIDAIIDKRLDNEDDSVPPNSSFLLGIRPKGMTNDLVYKAVIKNDKAARKLIAKMISRPFAEYKKGFDGVIIYDEVNVPRFSLMMRGTHDVFKKTIPSPGDPNSVWETFCTMMPEVTRKP
jgi:hypothetical protein